MARIQWAKMGDVDASWVFPLWERFEEGVIMPFLIVKFVFLNDVFDAFWVV